MALIYYLEHLQLHCFVLNLHFLMGPKSKVAFDQLFPNKCKLPHSKKRGAKPFPPLK